MNSAFVQVLTAIAMVLTIVVPMTYYFKGEHNKNRYKKSLSSPLLLPEQAKMCESSLFTRGFTHFGSFRGKRMAPERKLRCLYIFLFHFAPLIL